MSDKNEHENHKARQKQKSNLKLLIGYFLKGSARVKHYFYKCLVYVQPLIHVEFYINLLRKIIKMTRDA